MEYADRLHFMLNNGHISIRTRKRKEATPSTTSIVDGKKHIKLIRNRTVEDSYTTTHEFFHYDNMDVITPTINFELMTECISITSESLQKMWFERQRHQPKDYQLNEMDTLYALKVKAMKLHFELQLISSSDDVIKSSSIIIPSYLSKGLEFDGVIIYNNLKNTYESNEKNLYYVACTRAQHKLNIYNEPSKILIKKNAK